MNDSKNLDGNPLPYETTIIEPLQAKFVTSSPIIRFLPESDSALLHSIEARVLSLLVLFFSLSLNYS